MSSYAISVLVAQAALVPSQIIDTCLLSKLDSAYKSILTCFYTGPMLRPTLGHWVMCLLNYTSIDPTWVALSPHSVASADTFTAAHHWIFIAPNSHAIVIIELLSLAIRCVVAAT